MRTVGASELLQRQEEQIEPVVKVEVSADGKKPGAQEEDVRAGWVSSVALRTEATGNQVR